MPSQPNARVHVNLHATKAARERAGVPYGHLRYSVQERSGKGWRVTRPDALSLCLRDASFVIHTSGVAYFQKEQAQGRSGKNVHAWVQGTLTDEAPPGPVEPLSYFPGRGFFLKSTGVTVGRCAFVCFDEKGTWAYGAEPLELDPNVPRPYGPGSTPNRRRSNPLEDGLPRILALASDPMATEEELRLLLYIPFDEVAEAVLNNPNASQSLIAQAAMGTPQARAQAVRHPGLPRGFWEQAVLSLSERTILTAFENPSLPFWVADQPQWLASKLNTTDVSLSLARAILNAPSQHPIFQYVSAFAVDGLPAGTWQRTCVLVAMAMRGYEADGPVPFLQGKSALEALASSLAASLNVHAYNEDEDGEDGGYAHHVDLSYATYGAAGHEVREVVCVVSLHDPSGQVEWSKQVDTPTLERAFRAWLDPGDNDEKLYTYLVGEP